ncbi:DUF4190 domain-containing protein [Rhizomonospora bruguierae]|uniref:DUF4190 domain-containing protein n=1 Tax=Rhizomonospora bruguierae TaxID=1581705 RepID=UPI0020BE4859|nr:DUF4190 domain-containing protein [Micromonospora sp. NBRC 107566]
MGPAPGPNPSYGPPPYAPYAYPFPYPAPYNTYSILALVFAVAVFPPLGIYFGRKARQQIAQTGERGSELATVGIVVGWVFTSIYGLFILLWCGMAATMFASVPWTVTR